MSSMSICIFLYFPHVLKHTKLPSHLAFFIFLAIIANDPMFWAQKNCLHQRQPSVYFARKFSPLTTFCGNLIFNILVIFCRLGLWFRCVWWRGGSGWCSWIRADSARPRMGLSSCPQPSSPPSSRSISRNLSPPGARAHCSTFCIWSRRLLLWILVFRRRIFPRFFS